LSSAFISCPHSSVVKVIITSESTSRERDGQEGGVQGATRALGREP
jgi:hypothetical protein